MQVFLLDFFLGANMKKFKSVEKLVNQLKPNDPVYCIRKHPIINASKFFQKIFLEKYYML